MKKTIITALSVFSLSLTACATTRQPDTGLGRVIEFKSGMGGFDTRTFFYEGRDEVVAIDAQFTPALARESIAHLRKFTAKPIRWLVITHPNPDKFNGASEFKLEGARIIASQATTEAIPGVHAYKQYFFVELAKMFKASDYPQPVSVDETFVGSKTLTLAGGERLELQELSQPGVSSTQTVMWVRAANALFVGDLVHHRAHAWLEGGIVNGQPTPTIGGWIADLRELLATYDADTQVYGGRGENGQLGEVAPAQIEYLKKAQELVRQDLRRLGQKAGDYNGPAAGALYKDLTAKFAMAFPSYALAYMIEYGAYGLVQSELKK